MERYQDVVRVLVEVKKALIDKDGVQVCVMLAVLRRETVRPDITF